MRCLMIHAGPRRDNAWHVFMEVRKELARIGGGDVHEILLSTLDIPQCDGCDLCRTSGAAHCPHHALVGALAKEVKSADAIVITTALYHGSFPSTVISWLEHFTFLLETPISLPMPVLAVCVSRERRPHPPMAAAHGYLCRFGFEHVHKLHLVLPAAEPIGPKTRTRIRRALRRFGRDVLRQGPPSFTWLAYYNRQRALAVTRPGTRQAENWRAADALSAPAAVQLPLFHRAFAHSVYGALIGLDKAGRFTRKAARKIIALTRKAARKSAVLTKRACCALRRRIKAAALHTLRTTGSAARRLAARLRDKWAEAHGDEK